MKESARTASSHPVVELWFRAGSGSLIRQRAWGPPFCHYATAVEPSGTRWYGHWLAEDPLCRSSRSESGPLPVRRHHWTLAGEHQSTIDYELELFCFWLIELPARRRVGSRCCSKMPGSCHRGKKSRPSPQHDELGCTRVKGQSWKWIKLI